MSVTTPLQLVWFKRDLRVHDHEPLARAARQGPVHCLYVIEPAPLQAPDSSAQHLAFVLESLRELDRDLRQHGLWLDVQVGDVIDVLATLWARHAIATLWSHQETGNALSFARDRSVAAFCRMHGIGWQQCRQHGVVRCLPNRDDWSQRWLELMQQPVFRLPTDVQAAFPDVQSSLPVLARLPVNGADKPARQRGGRRAAENILTSFWRSRMLRYRSGLSSPLSAASSCSRLSPYLAYGVLSLRAVVQGTWALQAELAADPRPGAAHALRQLQAFEERLHWHCHFIQKLESEWQIEQRPVHQGFIGLREAAFDPHRFACWQRGETGLPLVDACMRYLAHTGWLNFRMRAMLVSVASYQLWLHWPPLAQHLAREFLDYEPGIHYPQIQMQSGVTGINVIRLYDPIKQARDQDPQALFVRRWLPALRQVPDSYVFEPWRMPANVQQRCGVRVGRDIPPPVVDPKQSLQLARERMYAWRRQLNGSSETERVLHQHGSRWRQRRDLDSRRKSEHNANSNQLSLDGL